MSQLLSDQELGAAIAEMPAVSAVLQRMLAVLQDPHSDLDDISRLVRAETALAAQVLRVANSAFFSLPEPATTIGEAIQRLGVGEINRIVSMLASRQLFLGMLRSHGIAGETLWHHALAVAVGAEVLAGQGAGDRPTAYLTGILHPVGIVALDRVATARGMKPRSPEAALLVWEQQTFGVNNATVAGRVLGRWQFPETLAAIVAARYEPETAPTDATQVGATVLHLASVLAEKLGAGLAPERGAFRPLPERLERAGVPWDDFAEIQMETAEQLERTRALLRVA